MSEKIRTPLEEEWEKKLSELGLGEELKNPGEVSFDDVELSVEKLISPELLSRFSVLPEKIQEDIFANVRSLHLAGESVDNISEKTKILIDKAEELMNLDDKNSDTVYKAQDTQETVKLKKEEDSIKIEDEAILELENPGKKETIH